MSNTVNALAQAAGLTLAESDERNADLDGTAIDLQAYEGVGLFSLNSGAGTGTAPKLAAKLQHCATSGGTYADVTGGGFADVEDAAVLEILKLNVANLKRYVKLIGTLTGTTPVFDYGAEFIGIKKAVSS